MIKVKTRQNLGFSIKKTKAKIQDVHITFVKGC